MIKFEVKSVDLNIYPKLIAAYMKSGLLPDGYRGDVVSVRKHRHAPNVGIVTLAFGQKKFVRLVMKVMKKGNDSYDLHPSFILNDMLAQQKIERLGLRPRKYLLFDPEGLNPYKLGCAITQYIPGKTLLESKYVLETTFVELEEMLLILHKDTPKTNFGRFIDPFRKTVEYATFASDVLLSDLERDGISLPPNVYNNLSILIDRLRSIKQFCLCHADITARNTLINCSHPILIDWSYGGYMHPAIDIAYLISILIDRKLTHLAIDIFTRSTARYEKLGFNLNEHIHYFLAFRYLEIARIPTQRDKLLLAYALIEGIPIIDFILKTGRV